MKAVWNGEIIAESSDALLVEGRYYFPAASVKHSYLQKSDHISYCASKGYATYFHITLLGMQNPDAVRMYPHPYPCAVELKGRFTFLSGVEVVE